VLILKNYSRTQNSALTRTVARTAKNNQYIIFSPSVVLAPEIKKLFKNMQTPKLCLKMILGHRILLVLIISSARTAENN